MFDHGQGDCSSGEGDSLVDSNNLDQARRLVGDVGYQPRDRCGERGEGAEHEQQPATLLQR